MRSSAYLTLIVPFFFVSDAKADVIYTYTGNTYGSMLPADPAFAPTVTGAYSLDDRISGFLVFAEELALPELHHETANAIPLAYEFSDGVQTLTESNSYIYFSFGGFSLLGDYGSWAVDIWTDPVDGFVNRIQTIVTYRGSGDSWETAQYMGSYARVDPNPNPGAGNPGTWTVTTTTAVSTEGATVQDVPEPSTLLLVSTGALGAGLRRGYSRKR
jgi:hypothetical protein